MNSLTCVAGLCVLVVAIFFRDDAYVLLDKSLFVRRLLLNGVAVALTAIVDIKASASKAALTFLTTRFVTIFGEHTVLREFAEICVRPVHTFRSGVAAFAKPYTIKYFIVALLELMGFFILKEKIGRRIETTKMSGFISSRLRKSPQTIRDACCFLVSLVVASVVLRRIYVDDETNRHEVLLFCFAFVASAYFASMKTVQPSLRICIVSLLASLLTMRFVFRNIADNKTAGKMIGSAILLTILLAHTLETRQLSQRCTIGIGTMMAAVLAA